MSITVLVYSEISAHKDLITYVTRADDYYGDVLKNFNFSSGKSLIHFLNKHKENIINRIPATEIELLEKLEKQNFLEHLNSKWYDAKYLNIDFISPEQIYDIAVKYKCFTQKQIINYLLEKKDGYVYDAVIKQI